MSSNDWQSVNGGSLDVCSCNCHNPAFKPFSSTGCSPAVMSCCQAGVTDNPNTRKTKKPTVWRFSITPSTTGDDCEFINCLISSWLFTIAKSNSRMFELSRSCMLLRSLWFRWVSILDWIWYQRCTEHSVCEKEGKFLHWTSSCSYRVLGWVCRSRPSCRFAGQRISSDSRLTIRLSSPESAR